MNWDALSLKDVVTVFVAIITALLAYLFGKRKDNNTENNQIAKDNLEVISKLYFDLIYLKHNFTVNNLQNRLVLYLENKELSITKTYNDKLIAKVIAFIYQLEDHELNDLLEDFDQICALAEKEYWLVLGATGTNYGKWKLERNFDFFTNLSANIIRFIVNGISFIFVLSIILTIFSFWAIGTSVNIPYKEDLAVISLIMLIIFWILFCAGQLISLFNNFLYKVERHYIITSPKVNVFKRFRKK